MRGIQRLTFFYFMYGSAIETLSVYVKDQTGEELKVWSHHGGKLSGTWSEGCATLNYSGSYQVASQISGNKLYHVVRKKKSCWRFVDLFLECCYILVDYSLNSRPEASIYAMTLRNKLFEGTRKVFPYFLVLLTRFLNQSVTILNCCSDNAYIIFI